MANWFNRLNVFNKSGKGELVELEKKLDQLTDEMKDFDSYETKFVDGESASSSPTAGGDYAGIDQELTVAALQRIYCTETWVYAAVSSLSETIAQLPLKLEKRTIINKAVINDVTGVQEVVPQEIWHDATGEPLFNLFQSPNPYTTKTELMTLLVIDLMTAGEFFILQDSPDGSLMNAKAAPVGAQNPYDLLRALVATPASKIQGLYRLPPSMMTIVRSKQGVEGYAIQNDHGAHVFNAPEIIHVKLPNPLDGNHGLSPLVPALKPVLLDRFSTEHMVRFYKSGARLGGVISTEKSLNKEQLARFQRSFENNYTGRQNHHRTLILPPGMKYTQIGQNPAETALLDFCKYNREAILAVYKVPPVKVGVLDHANYANARAQLSSYFRDSVKPKIAFFEDGFNLKSAVMPAGYRVRFDLSEVEELKEDEEVKAKTGKAMLDAGYTVNEVRKDIWKKEPVDGGDIVPAIESAKRNGGTGGNEIQGWNNLAAPEPAVAKDPAADGNPLAGLAGPQITSIMNILARVTKGRLTKEAAAELLVGVYGFTMARAFKLVGLEIPAEKLSTPELTPPTDIMPTAGTFADRVRELIAQMIQAGIPLDLAVPKALEQAKLEGFADADITAGKDGLDVTAWTATLIGTGKPKKPGEKCEKCQGDPCICPPDLGKSLNDFIADAIKTTDEAITPEFIAELTELWNARHGNPTKDTTPTAAALPAHGMTKEAITAHWKSFIEKTDPIVQRRLGEVRKFFKDYQSVILNRVGANIKAFGLHKTLEEDDIEKILAQEGVEGLQKLFADEADQSLLEAYKEGFSSTLVKFEIRKEPDADSVARLKEYGATEVEGITDTTIEQMRALLTEQFQKGASIGDVAKALREKFDEIDQGRALTIARTETLSAVSFGAEEKRQEVQRQYPDVKFAKMWITAQDSAVRDSHDALEGVSIDVNDVFDNGCRYPRDPDGDAKEVINCRCTEITYDTADEDLVRDSTEEPAQPAEKSVRIRNFMWFCFARKHAKGGEGSGCTGPNCGRPPGGGHPTDAGSGRHGLPQDLADLVARKGPGEGRQVEYSREQLTQLLDKGTFALLSAGRNPKIPADVALTDAQIGTRYNSLAADLQQSGYAYTKVEGHYSGKEDSFLVQVHEADRTEMLALGEKYNQDSVIYTGAQKNEMVFTTGPDKGKALHGTGYSWEDNADDFYTEVTHPDGKVSKFQLKFNFDVPPKSAPQTESTAAPAAPTPTPVAQAPPVAKA